MEYCFIGHLILPSINISPNVNNPIGREEYVKYCFKKNICYVMDINGRIVEAKIGLDGQNSNDGIINSLDFPYTQDQKGTCVLVLQMPFGGFWIIARSDENNLFRLDEEYQIKLFKASGLLGNTSFAGLDIRGLKGIISLIVSSNQSDGSKISLEAKNSNKTAEINLKTDFINLLAEKIAPIIKDELLITINNFSIDKNITTFQIKKGDGLHYKDEYGNEINNTSGSLELKHRTQVKIGDGSEPIVLGNQLNAVLGEFLTNFETIIQTSMWAVNIGTAMTIPMPTNYSVIKTLIETTKNKLNIILSQYAFTE